MSNTWHTQTLAAKAIEALKKNGFEALYFPTTKNVQEYVLQTIATTESVGVGGSKTLDETGIIDALETRGNKMLIHFKPNLTLEESLAICRQQLTCDTFICSTNAFTLDGKLANVDGRGNRIASMTFGPKQVIVVTGINKLTQNIEEALKRVQMYAAPQNAHRLEKSTPCAKTGACIDCQSPERICRITSIMHRRPSAINSYIICIVGEQLGF